MHFAKHTPYTHTKYPKLTYFEPVIQRFISSCESEAFAKHTKYAKASVHKHLIFGCQHSFFECRMSKQLFLCICSLDASTRSLNAGCQSICSLLLAVFFTAAYTRVIAPSGASRVRFLVPKLIRHYIAAYEELLIP